MSYNLLVQNSRNSTKEVELLDCFAFLDGNDISEEMFSAFITHIHEADWPPWLKEFLDDEGNWSSNLFGDAISNLKVYSLITTFTVVDEYIHCSIYPLVKDWIKLRQPAENLLHNFHFASKLLSSWIAHRNWSSFELDAPVIGD